MMVSTATAVFPVCRSPMINSPVERLSNRVNHPADDRISDGNLGDPAGAFNGISLFDSAVFPQKDDADAVFLQIKNGAEYAVGKLQQFPRQGRLQSVYFCDAVTDLQDGAHLLDIDRLLEILDLLFNNLRNLRRSDLHLLRLHEFSLESL